MFWLGVRGVPQSCGSGCKYVASLRYKGLCSITTFCTCCLWPAYLKPINIKAEVIAIREGQGE